MSRIHKCRKRLLPFRLQQPVKSNFQALIDSRTEAIKRKEAELTQAIVGQGKSLDQAKMTASWMLRTGKSQAQVEVLLYE